MVVDCNVLVLLGAKEADCFRQVAVLHSDHYRQVPLVGWLPYTVTTIDWSH